LFAGNQGRRLVALAGVRHTHTLARGNHVFIDDLIVHGDDQARGIGRQIMTWLADWALGQGAPMLYLDSRDTAKGFYQALGFKFLTSLPCFVPPESLHRTGR
ncbi:MAG: GNAT family N-acetyltransferase, partial [Clostridia bacterium]|nr:GNAT family N-acetyltransferase [Deltaproteobacteria bacterium]